MKISPPMTPWFYVNIHEPDPAARHQLIDYYLSMWIVELCEDFFNNGIVNKYGDLKNRKIMLKTRVVMTYVQAFHDIYLTFQFYQFDLINNVPGKNILSTLPESFIHLMQQHN